MRYRAILLLLVGANGHAQMKSAAVPDPARTVELAEHGRCQEALPALKRATSNEKDLQRRLGVAGVRCAMTLNQPADAALFLDRLNREFPHDAAVLYLATHVYSDLATRASEELLYTSPASPEVHELNAEALETRGDWQHAMEEYRTVLQRDPNRTGMHYRIGRLILSQPKTDATFSEAKTEFEAELRVDPGNAGAEYVLGEISRQEEQWAAAIDHFSKASRLDAGFSDAFIGLGRSLLSAERPVDAVAPLMNAARLDPRNPTAHYYAAIALQRAGRKADSDHEAALFKESSAKTQQAKDDVQLGVLGPQRVERR